MKINNRLFSIFISGFILSSLISAILIRDIIKDTSLHNEVSELKSISQKKVDLLDTRIKKSEEKLKGFARILELELAKPIKQDEIVLFHQIMEQNNGVWLNRKSTFNGEIETGLFVPESSNPTHLQKIQNLRIKLAMDVFGSGSLTSENIWFLSFDRSEIMFDKSCPNYVFNEPPDADYTQTPWLQIGLPNKSEKNKEVLVTPPLFDPANETWIVSAVYPIYVNHTWIGNIGEDTHLTSSPP